MNMFAILALFLILNLALSIEITSAAISDTDTQILSILVPVNEGEHVLAVLSGSFGSVVLSSGTINTDVSLPSHDMINFDLPETSDIGFGVQGELVVELEYPTVNNGKFIGNFALCPLAQLSVQYSISDILGGQKISSIYNGSSICELKIYKDGDSGSFQIDEYGLYENQDFVIENISTDEENYPTITNSKKESHTMPSTSYLCGDFANLTISDDRRMVEAEPIQCSEGGTPAVFINGNFPIEVSILSKFAMTKEMVDSLTLIAFCGEVGFFPEVASQIKHDFPRIGAPDLNVNIIPGGYEVPCNCDEGTLVQVDDDDSYQECNSDANTFVFRDSSSAGEKNFYCKPLTDGKMGSMNTSVTIPANVASASDASLSEFMAMDSESRITVMFSCISDSSMLYSVNDENLFQNGMTISFSPVFFEYEEFELGENVIRTLCVQPGKLVGAAEDSASFETIKKIAKPVFSLTNDFLKTTISMTCDTGLPKYGFEDETSSSRTYSAYTELIEVTTTEYSKVYGLCEDGSGGIIISMEEVVDMNVKTLTADIVDPSETTRTNIFGGIQQNWCCSNGYEDGQSATISRNRPLTTGVFGDYQIAEEECTTVVFDEAMTDYYFGCVKKGFLPEDDEAMDNLMAATMLQSCGGLSQSTQGQIDSLRTIISCLDCNNYCCDGLGCTPTFEADNHYDPVDHTEPFESFTKTCVCAEEGRVTSDSDEISFDAYESLPKPTLHSQVGERRSILSFVPPSKGELYYSTLPYQESVEMFVKMSGYDFTLNNDDTVGFIVLSEEGEGLPSERLQFARVKYDFPSTPKLFATSFPIELPVRVEVPPLDGFQFGVLIKRRVLRIPSDFPEGDLKVYYENTLASSLVLESWEQVGLGDVGYTSDRRIRRLPIAAGGSGLPPFQKTINFNPDFEVPYYPAFVEMRFGLSIISGQSGFIDDDTPYVTFGIQNTEVKASLDNDDEKVLYNEGDSVNVEIQFVGAPLFPNSCRYSLASSSSNLSVNDLTRVVNATTDNIKMPVVITNDSSASNEVLKEAILTLSSDDDENCPIATDSNIYSLSWCDDDVRFGSIIKNGGNDITYSFDDLKDMTLESSISYDLERSGRVGKVSFTLQVESITAWNPQKLEGDEVMNSFF